MINKSVYRNVDSVESANKGVILEYVSESKSGVKTISFFEFTGEGYVPEKDDAQSNFKCWKKVICDFWNAKAEESVFKADNGGIACKLRSTTPTRAIIRGEGFEHVWKLDGSKWERIGLIPTKRDLEERAREYKKKMHKAAAASFAVAFGTQFEGDKEWVEMFGDCEAMPELSDADIMQQAREARANTPAHVLSSMCLV